jgi:hypothetical protein
MMMKISLYYITQIHKQTMLLTRMFISPFENLSFITVFFERNKKPLLSMLSKFDWRGLQSVPVIPSLQL